MCNEQWAMFVGVNIELIPIASGALAAIVAGLILAVLKRRWSTEDKREAEEKAAVETKLAQLGLSIATEIERSTNQDASLGYDIQETRNALSHLCGTLGKPNPAYDSRR